MTQEKTPSPDEINEAAAAEAPDDSGADTAETDELLDTLTEAAAPELQVDPTADEEGAPVPSLQEELDALNDRHLRLAAEFTNYKRRAEGERMEMWSRAQAELVGQFVDALDDLQRVGAWQAEATTVEALVEGVDLVERKFRQALEAAGVVMLEPAGEKFDPNTMEAMMRVVAESEEEDDFVQDVMQKGYMLKGHLVRPARVSVKKV